MEIKKDAQGHSLLSLNQHKGIASFCASLFKRSERLSTALYLVTNFLSESEPIKSRLRTLSLELIQRTGDVRYGAPMSESESLERIKGNIEETLALLELAFIAGIVSEMNFSILKREYASVRDVVEIKRMSRESRADAILGDTFFGQPFSHKTFEDKNFNTKNISQRTPQEVSKGQSIGHENNVMSFTMSDTTKSGTNKIIPKGHPKDTTSKVVVGQKSLNSIQSVEKDSRRNRIAKLVKDNREVSIKDIITHFPGVSEKTIQRELVSLTEGGVLKKSGERRWSRYSLA